MIANGAGSSGWREGERRLQIAEVAAEGTCEGATPRASVVHVQIALLGRYSVGLSLV